MYNHFQEKEQEAARIIKIGGAVLNAVASGAMLKSELNGLTAEANTRKVIAAGEASLNTKCFIAGTKVLLKDSLVCIENVNVGDSVWTFDEVKGLCSLERVERVSKSTASRLFHIVIGNDTITTTPGHPFFINNVWVEAKKIVVGDSVTLFDKSKKAISNISYKDTVASVYNFTVSNSHNYYVSKDRVLVHNDCLFKEFERRMGNTVTNLAGRMEMTEWGDMNLEIDAILKSADAAPGEAFKKLTQTAEQMAREQGATGLSIKFNMVVNPRLRYDPNWAREYGYHFSEEKNKFGIINIIWEKSIQ